MESVCSVGQKIISLAFLSYAEGGKASEVQLCTCFCHLTGSNNEMMLICPFVSTYYKGLILRWYFMYLVMVQLYFNVPIMLFFWITYHVILEDGDPRFTSHLFLKMFLVLLNWKDMVVYHLIQKTLFHKIFVLFLFALG